MRINDEAGRGGGGGSSSRDLEALRPARPNPALQRNGLLAASCKPVRSKICMVFLCSSIHPRGVRLAFRLHIGCLTAALGAVEPGRRLASPPSLYTTVKLHLWRWHTTVRLQHQRRGPWEQTQLMLETSCSRNMALVTARTSWFSRDSGRWCVKTRSLVPLARN